jgi:hypothetical protein
MGSRLWRIGRPTSSGSYGEARILTALLMTPKKAIGTHKLSLNQGNRKVISFTPDGKRAADMLSMIYTINKDATGVTFTCNECLYAVRLNEFAGGLGSRRTLAACAMLEHLRNEHGIEPIRKSTVQIMERWY